MPIKYLYDPRHATILLNWGNGVHGCKNNCKYCAWKSIKEGSYYSVPTKEELEELLKYCRGYVSLSGGGDPLWNYQEHKKDLLFICNFLHSNHRTIKLITREYDTLLLNIEDFKDVDFFKFSIDGKNEYILNIIKQLPTQKMEVCMVYNGQSLDELIQIVNYYKPYVRLFCMYENYFNHDFHQEYINITKSIKLNDINTSNFRFVPLTTYPYEFVYWNGLFSNTEENDSMLEKSFKNTKDFYKGGSNQ